MIKFEFNNYVLTIIICQCVHIYVIFTIINTEQNRNLINQCTYLYICNYNKKVVVSKIFSDFQNIVKY